MLTSCPLDFTKGARDFVGEGKGTDCSRLCHKTGYVCIPVSHVSRHSFLRATQCTCPLKTLCLGGSTCIFLSVNQFLSALYLPQRRSRCFFGVGIVQVCESSGAEPVCLISRFTGEGMYKRIQRWERSVVFSLLSVIFGWHSRVVVNFSADEIV